MFGLIGGYYRCEADFSSCSYVCNFFNYFHRNVSRNISCIGYGMYSQGRFYAEVLSGCSYIQSKLTVE